MIKKYEIYVDLDGVLADFDYGVFTHTGSWPRDLDDATLWEKIKQIPNFYRQLELMRDANILWETVHKYNPQILTAIPRRITLPEAEQDKRDWVCFYFGNNIPVNIGPYSKDKQKWAATNRILIDDRQSNIEEWQSHGGIGILHKNAITTIHELQKIGL